MYFGNTNFSIPFRKRFLNFTKIWLEKCEDSSDGGETSDTAEKERKGENTAQSTEDTGTGTASTALNVKDTVALGTTTEYIDEYTYIETSYELTRYVNDINTAYVEVLMKYDENDNVKASYIYGTNRVSETLDNSVDKYYNYDIRGTVVQTTDSDGNIAQIYSYTTNGTLVIKDGTDKVYESIESASTVYAYTGEEYNIYAELLYLRYRYMDTETGRFISEDSYAGIITDPLSQNRYIYVKNNPIGYTDPSGHKGKGIEEWVKERKKKAEKNWKEFTKAVGEGLDYAGEKLGEGLNYVGNKIGDYAEGYADFYSKPHNVILSLTNPSYAADFAILNTVKTFAVEPAKDLIDATPLGDLHKDMVEFLDQPLKHPIKYELYNPLFSPLMIVGLEIYKNNIKDKEELSTLDKFMLFVDSKRWRVCISTRGELVHDVLDNMGMIPGIGDVFDGANAIGYLMEKNYVDALISSIALLPILGELAPIVRKTNADEVAGKALKEGTDAVESMLKKQVKQEVAETVGKEVTEQAAKEVSGEAIEKAIKNLTDASSAKTQKKSIFNLSLDDVKVDGKSGSANIPDKVKNIVQQIKDNKGVPTKGYKGGKTYKNIPLEEGAQKLPEGVNYKEYDINPYIKGQNRGAERIVIGDDGSVWYTDDHYYTFTQIE